jgi:selenium metabolism protein YedF
MKELIVDARGQVCPKPLIMTKKALKELEKDQPLIVLIDNDTSKKNVERFLIDNGIQPSIVSSAGLFTFTINGSPRDVSRFVADAVRAPVQSPSNNPYVILFRNNMMGNGPEELGTILIKAFINTIKEISPLPGAIVFYTNGVLLTIEGSPVLEPLQELERMGIKLLVCGTCADYFKIKVTVRVGTISNMYTILETLAGAGHVVMP